MEYTMRAIIFASIFAMTASNASADSGKSPYHGSDLRQSSFDYSTTGSNTSGGDRDRGYIEAAVRAAETNLLPTRDRRINPRAKAQIEAEIQDVKDVLRAGNLSASDYSALRQRMARLHRDISAATN
jgi:hypothetical protein